MCRARAAAIGESKPSLAHIAMLIALCMATYANTLSGGFVWDDQFQVERNSLIREAANIPRAFTSAVWSFADSRSGNYYRPFQTVFFGFGYLLGGLSPFYYHVINVLLHSVATVFAYLLCIELSIPVTVAAIIGALFASHPVHTEAVAWIAAVGELSCGAFYFASVWAFAKFLNTYSRRWILLSSGCFLGALLSKEMAITLPAFIIGLTLFLDWRRGITLKNAAQLLWPYAAALAVYLSFRFVAVGLRTSSALDVTASPIDWVTLGIDVLGRYLWYSAVPYPLVAYHSVPLHLSDRYYSTLLSGAGISTVLFLLWRYRQRAPFVSQWFGLFLITLLPVLYLRAFYGAFFSERYLYIPTLPALILIVLLLRRLLPKYGTAFCCIIVGIFCVLTPLRNLDWRDNETLYSRTVERNPAVAPFWSGLGIVQIETGNLDLAQSYYETALQHATDSRYVQLPDEVYRAHIGLGVIAARRKDFVSARAHFEQAMNLYPAGSLSYTYLGGVFLVYEGNYPRAIELFQRAIDLSPIDDLARDYMGLALFNQGHTEEAVRFFEEALQINPRLKEAQEHLNLARSHSGKP